jgi:hypothetical protein
MAVDSTQKRWRKVPQFLIQLDEGERRMPLVAQLGATLRNRSDLSVL